MRLRWIINPSPPDLPLATWNWPGSAGSTDKPVSRSMAMTGKTSFSLANSSADFQPLFLDYPDGEEEFFELDSGFEPLPGPWSQRGGLRLTGSNRSDDLLMLWMRPLDGLEPETSYELTFESTDSEQ